MDFKYTKSGSAEQYRSLLILNELIGQWAIFLRREEIKLAFSNMLESRVSI